MESDFTKHICINIQEFLCFSFRENLTYISVQILADNRLTEFGQPPLPPPKFKWIGVLNHISYSLYKVSFHNAYSRNVLRGLQNQDLWNIWIVKIKLPATSQNVNVQYLWPAITYTGINCIHIYPIPTYHIY